MVILLVYVIRIWWMHMVFQVLQLLLCLNINIVRLSLKIVVLLMIKLSQCNYGQVKTNTLSKNIMKPISIQSNIFWVIQLKESFWPMNSKEKRENAKMQLMICFQWIWIQLWQEIFILPIIRLKKKWENCEKVFIVFFVMRKHKSH